MLRIKRLLAPPLILAARPIFLLAIWLAAKLPPYATATRSAQRFGVHILRRHYYSPIPDAADLPEGYWERESAMPGVDLREEHALSLLQETLPPHLAEFRQRFPLDLPPSQTAFHLFNGSYMAVDAHLYYGLIRHFHPRRVVEIGSGRSTQLAAAALAANARNGSPPGRLTAIEPYPPPALLGMDGSTVEILQNRVQDVPQALFAELQGNDILFIDSSHVLREGNDVQYEYLEILPRLRPGVLVHVHDVSLPRPYPRVYFDSNLFWNEQYLLQAYLIHNRAVRVIWPGNYLMLRHAETMHAAFPEIALMRERYPSSEPSAFWFQTTEG